MESRYFCQAFDFIESSDVVHKNYMKIRYLILTYIVFSTYSKIMIDIAYVTMSAKSIKRHIQILRYITSP